MPRDPIVLARDLLGSIPDEIEPLVVWTDRATHRVTIGSERFVMKTDDDLATVAREAAGQQRAAAAGVAVPESSPRSTTRSRCGGSTDRP